MRYRKESNDKTDNSIGLDFVSFSCRTFLKGYSEFLAAFCNTIFRPIVLCDVFIEKNT